MLAGIISRARSLWRESRRRAEVDADMSEEFQHHMELRATDLVRSGLTPADAARQAKLEFGSTEQFKHKGARSRGLRRIDDVRVSWLDFKLGFRMLARYPGLTLVGGLAMAFAIWLGAGVFELVTQVLRPSIPLPDGNRIVAIGTWDAQKNRPEPRVAHDFVAWKRELRSITDLGAYRELQRNLIAGTSGGEPVEVAEITASAFRMTRVPPLLGRTLVAADERPEPSSVLVISYDAWQRFFAGDPNVIGRTVRLATRPVTIVGVMPAGFAFPVAHRFWIPLRLNVLEYGRRDGPAIRVFGRLAPGASRTDAQTELAALGQRAAVEFRETHQHLRPQVVPYARSIVNITGWWSVGVMSINVPIVMLVLLLCANVALLMFARAASRESEIIVRTALGAGRGRILMQLFAEALVLGGVATIVGLAAAGSGLRWVMGVVEAEFLNGGRLPFWFQDRLSPTTVLYAILLTVVGAVVAGVVPALKVTRGLSARLKATTAGGGGVRFGGLWTAIIVAQVAVTVAFPAVAYFVRRDARQIEAIDVGFRTNQYLSLRLEMDRSVSVPNALGTSEASDTLFRHQFQRTYTEFERRLSTESAVARVAFANRLPLMYHPARLIEVDEGGAAPLNPEFPGGYRVSSASVDAGFFDAVEAPVLSGRGFRASDDVPDRTEPGTSGAQPGVVIVNRSFVRLVLGDRNPIGRRIRYLRFEEYGPVPDATRGPWYEIVGVVRDLGMAVGADAGAAPGSDPKVAGIYHPVAPGNLYPAHVALQVRGDPEAFVPRLRAIATSVDPALRLYDIMPLNEATKAELKFLSFWFRLLLMVSTVALVLSLAAIYAVMAFTVARRTREIGIRVALGASTRRVAAATFAQPLRQVAYGVLGGMVIVGILVRLSTGRMQLAQIAVVLAYAAMMMAMCLLACIVPTRRALRVPPTEALRADP
jgi:predicted permease